MEDEPNFRKRIRSLPKPKTIVEPDPPEAISDRPTAAANDNGLAWPLILFPGAGTAPNSHRPQFSSY